MNFASKEQKRNILLLIFWILIIAFLITVSIIFIPAFREYMSASFMIISGIILILLSGVLIFLTLKQKVEGKLKKYLILTGSSASGFFIFAFLHNIFYGFEMITIHIIILSYLMKVFEVIFFLIAIFVCPIGFLIGIVKSIVLLNKEKKEIS